MHAHTFSINIQAQYYLHARTLSRNICADASASICADISTKSTRMQVIMCLYIYAKGMGVHGGTPTEVSMGKTVV